MIGGARRNEPKVKTRTDGGDWRKRREGEVSANATAGSEGLWKGGLEPTTLSQKKSADPNGVYFFEGEAHGF